MKRNDLSIVLALASLAAGYYFYKRSSVQLAAAVGARYTPPIVPAGTPIDPRTLPGYQPGPDPINFQVSPTTRPGVTIDPATGDPSVDPTLADTLAGLGEVSYDF